LASLYARFSDFSAGMNAVSEITIFGFMLGIKKFFTIIPILVGLVHAANTVAVLEIIPSAEMTLKQSEYRHLTDELRRQARTVLPHGYAILTRDNILSLLPSDAEEAACLAESCAIDIGRAIGAEYVSQGLVGEFGGMLTLTVELYESISGYLLASFVTESKDVIGLLNTIREKAPELFSSITKNPSRKPVATEQQLMLVPAQPQLATITTGYTGSNKCYKEIFELSNAKKGFNISSFVKDLGISVAKVQASCKTKFTCPADDKITDVGLTAGCVKQLPIKPNEIISLLKELGMDAGIDLAQDLAASATIDPQVGSVEKKSNASFWVAITLDVVGAAMIGYGFLKNEDVKLRANEYDALMYSSQSEFDNAWKKVEDAKTTRNVSFIMGGILLASGIGVHIWF